MEPYQRRPNFRKDVSLGEFPIGKLDSISYPSRDRSLGDIMIAFNW